MEPIDCRFCKKPMKTPYYECSYVHDECSYAHDISNINPAKIIGFYPIQIICPECEARGPVPEKKRYPTMTAAGTISVMNYMRDSDAKTN